MKRIRKIEIENSRAYYDRKTFELAKGENLLLYGENGSGKTSLCKALNDFIQSFYSEVDYTPNRYKPVGAVGEITLSIGDYDQNAHEFQNITDYQFGDGVDNTHVQGTAYMKSLALSKGFLNYRDLLKLYLYEENNPNLFEFFVLHLLRNHVPMAQGWRVSLINEWESLKDDIFNVYSRNATKHHQGLARLNRFETTLRAVLTDLFAKVNNYLTNYFPNFNLSIDYELNPMTFSYHHYKWEWEICQDLRLKVNSGNSDVEDYTEGLNEARLSAIAICLYLSALRSNPGADLRLMFLDDIFIGIDSANRFPILKILDQEFRDFQIVMATYDRSWYCMAKKFLSNSVNNEWKCVSLFTLPKTEQGKTFMEPVLVDGKSDFDRAKEYLHGMRDIDLPAAANYFRKALEELLSPPHLPKELFMNEDYTPIPSFRLTNHVDAVVQLFMEVGIDIRYIHTIESYLHPLIHPLSHYEEEAQVYRNELLEVEKAFGGLYQQVNDIGHHCRLLFGYHTKMEIRFKTADMSYSSKYEILLEDNLWLYKDGVGQAHFTECACRAVHLEGIQNGVALQPFSPKPSDPRFTYKSLDDALQKLFEFETTVNMNQVEAYHDYDNVYLTLGRNVWEAITLRRGRLMREM